MALNFIQTSTASKGNGVKMLVYSIGGYGKTMLVATLPKPLLLSAESGLLSLTPENIARVYGKNTPGIAYDIPGIEIKSYADMLDAYNFVTTSPHAQAFESIALDSISEIAERVLTFEKSVSKDGRAAYGNMADSIATLIRQFRDLPGKHVYFSAKQDREKDEASGLMLYGPSMPGKTLTQGIDYFFDEVFNLNIAKLSPEQGGKTYRFLRTRPDPQYRAKDRSGALDEIEEPNLSKIINKITGKN